MGRVSDAKERLMDAVGELIWKGSYGSTTIDQICEKAGVKKGSFYYFFDSKADVAVAALDAGCKKKRDEMDSLFSPTVPPLDRIRNYCECAYKHQAEMKREGGAVLGCPLSPWDRRYAPRNKSCARRFRRCWNITASILSLRFVMRTQRA